VTATKFWLKQNKSFLNNFEEIYLIILWKNLIIENGENAWAKKSFFY
jgi:hypothetical protein